MYKHENLGKEICLNMKMKNVYYKAVHKCVR